MTPATDTTEPRRLAVLPDATLFCARQSTYNTLLALECGTWPEPVPVYPEADPLRRAIRRDTALPF